MTELIRMENITVPEISGESSFSILGGGFIVLLTPKYEVNAALARLLIGMEMPCSGKVFLFTSDTATLSGDELLHTRRRIGIAFGSGGLVSNLKAWENITLPLYFHNTLSNAEIEERGVTVLGRLGYTGNLMALPGLLTFTQRKLIGIARAMLMDPDVIIYESPDSGLNSEEKSHFFKIATEYHREKPGRASVFITSNKEVLSSLPEAVVFNLTKVNI
jgi:phospholipid/cholesterol/gamma-HCH transport system ATP-binding protein